MIQVICATCGLRIMVPETVQGRAGVCFGCGNPVHVPLSKEATPEQVINFDAGTRIDDRYVIDSKIGKGGMGIVYKAHDALIDEDIALKFMHPRALKTQRGQQMFIKEAQICRRLRHENIVCVHDVSTTPEGVLYLSMELLKGVSLRTYLKKHRVDRLLVDVHLAVELVLQMLSALEYAHKMVVHRDLKPENVMLLPGDRAKVLDFGLALAVEEEQMHREGASKPKRVVGTAVYASPEQHQHQTIDIRSDIYSLGLIMHELLTLRTPIDEPVTVVDVRQDVAPSIIDVLHRAVMKPKDRRWQSSHDFREALQEAYANSYSRTDITSVESASGRQVSTENMVYLQGGSFMMGGTLTREESPEFETQIEAFYIDKYPVTVEEYGQFIEETSHREPKYWHDTELNGPRQPICGVSFDDALAYAVWVGKLLPTEKQWEFAARGKDDRKYPWGSLEPDTSICNFGDYLGMPSIVTMHEDGSTPEGIIDMAGNLFEWTLGAWIPYKPENGGDTTSLSEPRRVVRGGSWHSQPNELRSCARKGLFRESQLTTVGFRCALPAPSIDTPADFDLAGDSAWSSADED